MPRAGRPIVGDEPRNKQFTMKFTQTEFNDVAEYAKAHELTVTRTLINAFYEMKKNERKQ